MSEERTKSTAADCSAATDVADATEPSVRPTSGVSQVVASETREFDRGVFIDWTVHTDQFVVDLFSDATSWMYAR